MIVLQLATHEFDVFLNALIVRFRSLGIIPIQQVRPQRGERIGPDVFLHGSPLFRQGLRADRVAELLPGIIFPPAFQGEGFPVGRIGAKLRFGMAVRKDGAEPPSGKHQQQLRGGVSLQFVSKLAFMDYNRVYAGIGRIRNDDQGFPLGQSFDMARERERPLLVRACCQKQQQGQKYRGCSLHHVSNF